MIHLSHQTEMLARSVAAARGITVEEAIRLALEESRKNLSVSSSREDLSRDELIRRMEEISARCATRPLIDPRSRDEIIGYDDYGLPK